MERVKKSITMKRYAKLAGTLGNTKIRSDSMGSSWMLADGSLVSERKEPDGWSWWLTTEDKR